MTEDNNDDSSSEITTYLNNQDMANEKNKAIMNKLIYSHLKNIARNRMATESRQGTISVTDLVNEAYLKLDATHSIEWQSRRHYYGAAAEAMRRILIDRARYKLRNKREAQNNVIELNEEIHLVGVNTTELVQLDDALSDLEAIDDDMATLVKLNYFAGLSTTEIAELTDSSPRTVARKIQTARAWLLTQMNN